VKDLDFHFHALDHYGHGQSDGMKGLLESEEQIKQDCYDFVKK
jgi:hypothetical protein